MSTALCRVRMGYMTNEMTLWIAVQSLWSFLVFWNFTAQVLKDWTGESSGRTKEIQVEKRSHWLTVFSNERLHGKCHTVLINCIRTGTYNSLIYRQGAPPPSLVWYSLHSDYTSVGKKAHIYLHVRCSCPNNLVYDSKTPWIPSSGHLRFQNPKSWRPRDSQAISAPGKIP